MTVEQIQHWLPIANAILSVAFLAMVFRSKSLFQAVWRGAIFAAITFSLVALILPMPNVGPWKLEVLVGTMFLAAMMYGMKKLYQAVAAGIQSAVSPS
jgi:uncharacterized membrane protein YwaF